MEWKITGHAYTDWRMAYYVALVNGRFMSADLILWDLIGFASQK